MSDKEDDEQSDDTGLATELCAEPLWSVSLESEFWRPPVCAVPAPVCAVPPPVCAVPAPVCAVPAVRPARVWNRRFDSNYDLEPPESAERCDKVSEAFNQSTMDRVIIIFSHGGVVDDGTNQPLKRPMFRTGQPVIFPVRYGSTIRIRDDWMNDILSRLPVATVDHPKLTGAQLIFGLEGLNLSNTCIRQHDEGTDVSNLELFTPGVHLGGDGIFLVDTFTKMYKRLRRRDFKKMNIESVPKLKKTVKKNGKKIVLNENPLYKTSRKYKIKMGQQEDHPLTLADLCDAEHGLFKELTIDGYNLSQIPVVVLACRAGIAWDSGSTSNSSNSSNLSHPVISPKPSDYLTADDDMDESPQVNIDDDGYRFTRNDRFPRYRFADDFGGGGPAQEDRFTGDDFGCWNDGRFPAQEDRSWRADDFGCWNDGRFTDGGGPAQGRIFWNHGDADDDMNEGGGGAAQEYYRKMDEGGSRNATKKRGNRRRNATKKRGNRRRNATKKRGNRRRNATKKRRK